MTAVTRRTMMRHAAWATPVIAASIAIPAAAASAPIDEKRSRIAFTNATATVGRKPNTIYINTKIKVLDGPDQIDNLLLTITLTTGTTVLTRPWAVLAGWGVTEKVTVEVPGMVRGAPIGVQFNATADDCAPISAVDVVIPPEWWS